MLSGHERGGKGYLVRSSASWRAEARRLSRRIPAELIVLVFGMDSMNPGWQKNKSNAAEPNENRKSFETIIHLKR